MEDISHHMLFDVNHLEVSLQEQLCSVWLSATFFSILLEKH